MTDDDALLDRDVQQVMWLLVNDLLHLGAHPPNLIVEDRLYQAFNGLHNIIGRLPREDSARTTDG